jgi:hypothetical protein
VENSSRALRWGNPADGLSAGTFGRRDGLSKTDVRKVRRLAPRNGPMSIAAAKSLALQKGFTLLEMQNGACQLVDRYLGLPILNPATLTVHFSLEQAMTYLADLPDRRIGDKHGHW